MLRVIEGGQRQALAGDRREGGDALMAAAREEVRRRSDRRLVLGPDLFSDPAWDMLLDLFLARDTGQRVAVSSLCVASGIPTTTALRWIRLLEAQGLLLRERDREDGRRSFVDLTPLARDKVETLLRRSLLHRVED